MIRLPLYFRPQLDKITNFDNVNVVAIKSDAEQIAPNMWVVRKRKRYGTRGFESQVLIQSGKDYYWTFIPTNAKGVIPLEVMAARLMDMADGDRYHKERNIFIDIAITAKETNKADDKAKSYLWFLYPNEGDIKGVDDVNTKIATILPSSAKSTKRTIILMGGTNQQRESIIKAINANFTLKEKQILAGTMFQIKPIRGAAGTYSRARVLGSGGDVSVIDVDPKYAQDSFANVVVHEAIHALRDKDTSRHPDLRRHGGSLVGRDSDLEESLTDAETTTRENPLTQDDAASLGVGYYARLRKPEGKTSKDLVVDDRVKITKPTDNTQYKTSGKKGRRGQKLLLAEYPQTHISKLSLRGSSEAIDTYWQMRQRGNQQVNMQVYAPRATSTPKVAKGEIQTIQFKDGVADIIHTPKFRLPDLRARPPRSSPKPRRKAPASGLQSKRIGKQYYTRLGRATAVSRRPLGKRSRRR